MDRVEAAKPSRPRFVADDYTLAARAAALDRSNALALATRQGQRRRSTQVVHAQGVEAGFVYGKEMFVEGGGKTERIERPGLPGGNLLEHSVGDGRYQVRRDVDAV
mgnify:CR=1 FL=1